LQIDERVAAEDQPEVVVAASAKGCERLDGVARPGSFVLEFVDSERRIAGDRQL